MRVCPGSLRGWWPQVERMAWLGLPTVGVWLRLEQLQQFILCSKFDLGGCCACVCAVAAVRVVW